MQYRARLGACKCFFFASKRILTSYYDFQVVHRIHTVSKQEANDRFWLRGEAWEYLGLQDESLW